MTGALEKSLLKGDQVAMRCPCLSELGLWRIVKLSISMQALCGSLDFVLSQAQVTYAYDVSFSFSNTVSFMQKCAYKNDYSVHSTIHN